MKDQVNRTGFPRSGEYLAFVKFYVGLSADERKNVWIGPAKGSPGSFNYAVFPSSVATTKEQDQLLEPARAVALLIDKSRIADGDSIVRA